MTEATQHLYLCWGLMGVGVLTFLVLLLITAPYGRHYQNSGWGPQIGNRAGWIIMELPAVAVFAAVYAQGQFSGDLVPLIFLGIWNCHYIHRTFIFPFRMRTAGKYMPVLVVFLAIVFNSLNAYLNARWISELGRYETAWLSSPYFVAGVLVFFIGFAVNIHADTTLLRLRAPGETGYKIPQGGAYRWVSSPNYMGELIEWLGWALLTWSVSGLAFFVYTAANLVPRAISNHRWYRETFDDYPKERRRLIPYIF